ncbi:hypothetical protein N0V95_004755 [Ascochyta clinopodiicola]|nr:hypothetical protein N0V95_004755 [Ascochyta clinopodiicola]
MDMIRVLIEQAQLDVNAQHQFSENREASNQCFLDSGRYVKGESPLHALVRGEHWWHVNEALRYLLDRGANTELQDVTGMTPLSAVLNRCAWLIFDKTVVELLIQYGADVNAVDRAGDSCLAKACTDLEMVRLLLDHGAVVTQRVFIQAIDLKDFELLSLFLSRGGDPNVRGERKWPGSISVGYADRYPLHYAIAAMIRSFQGEEEKYERIVQTLLSHGADLCAGYGSTTILHELVRDYDDLTAILTLPSSTLNLNVVNAEGETPLHLACNKSRSRRRGSKIQSIATLLVARGADIGATDGQGNTIWHILARTGAYGHTDAELQNLLAFAQDLINTPNAAGETPLHIAMGKMHYPRILDLLLDNSGDLHARDGAGNSLLHVLLRNDWAVCMSGHVQKRNKQPFERLLAAGLDINARNDEGETPIFSFFRHAKVERRSEFRGPSMRLDADTKTSTSTCTTAEAYQAVYDIFAAAGVDWLATNAKGQNLLHITAGLRSDGTLRHDRQPRVKVESSRIRKFKVLVGYGLDTAAEDGEGRTPLDIAADLGHEDILDLFREH